MVVSKSDSLGTAVRTTPSFVRGICRGVGGRSTDGTLTVFDLTWVDDLIPVDCRQFGRESRDEAGEMSRPRFMTHTLCRRNLLIKNDGIFARSCRILLCWYLFLRINHTSADGCEIW